MKQCKKCLETKPLSLFHVNKMAAGGYRNVCSPCTREKARTVYLSSPASQTAQENIRLGLRNKQGDGVDRKKRLVTYSKVSQKRRLQKATPLTEWDSFVVEETLRLAKLRDEMTKTRWHVDHIVPLSYKNACGLHVGANLQVVPALWNIQKNNRSTASFWPLPEQAN